MSLVVFKKGLLANLPSVCSEGTLYITTDERAMYLDINDTQRVRLGDFQEFDTLASLQTNTNPSETALYYVKDINCLAKWNGTSYIQINLDTGVTAVEVTGSGNAVTSASYDAVSRKLILTMGATFVSPTDITNKVGDIGDRTVKQYVDGKIADVVAGSIDGLGALASKDKVAEADLEAALAAKINNKADNESVDSAITTAQSYTDEVIAGLDVADTAVATQLVSSVSEKDGKIVVNRRTLVADDIPEITQSKVTGLAAAIDGKQDTLEFNTAYDASTNKVATMSDVTNAVSGLSGAMHYIGESTTDPTTGTPAVAGVNKFSKGNVVTYNAKEFVYDGSAWRELGDESSFAVKGSIRDVDIAADAAISQSKIAGLESAMAGKATPADITAAIEALDVADTAETAKIVSAVVQTNGKIAVSRRNLVSDDIPALAIAKVNGLQAALDTKAGTDEVDAKVSAAIETLDNDDVAVAHQFVTAVSETGGVVSVVRAQPIIEDITGLKGALLDTEQNAKEYTDLVLTWGSF